MKISLTKTNHYSCSLLLDVSSDDNFDSVADQTVSVTTADDDVAGLTITEI